MTGKDYLQIENLSGRKLDKVREPALKVAQKLLPQGIDSDIQIQRRKK